MGFMNLNDGIDYLFRQYRAELRDPLSLRGFLRVALLSQTDEDEEWNVVEWNTKYTHGLFPNKEESVSGARNLGSIIREEFGLNTKEALTPDFFQAFEKAREKLEINNEELFPNNVFAADQQAYPEQAWLYDVIRTNSTVPASPIYSLQLKNVVIVFFSTFPTSNICLRQFEAFSKSPELQKQLLTSIFKSQKHVDVKVEFQYKALSRDQRMTSRVKKEQEEWNQDEELGKARDLLTSNSLQKKKYSSHLKVFGIFAAVCVVFVLLKKRNILQKLQN